MKWLLLAVSIFLLTGCANKQPNTLAELEIESLDNFEKHAKKMRSKFPPLRYCFDYSGTEFTDQLKHAYLEMLPTVASEYPESLSLDEVNNFRNFAGQAAFVRFLVLNADNFAFDKVSGQTYNGCLKFYHEVSVEKKKFATNQDYLILKPKITHASQPNSKSRLVSLFKEIGLNDKEINHRRHDWKFDCYTYTQEESKHFHAEAFNEALEMVASGYGDNLSKQEANDFIEKMVTQTDINYLVNNEEALTVNRAQMANSSDECQEIFRKTDMFKDHRELAEQRSAALTLTKESN